MNWPDGCLLCFSLARSILASPEAANKAPSFDYTSDEESSGDTRLIYPGPCYSTDFLILPKRKRVPGLSVGE